VHQPNWNVFWS